VEKHQRPDGLSRCKPIPGEDDDNGDPEEWVNDMLLLRLWLDTWDEQRTHSVGTTKIFQATERVSAQDNMLTFPPVTGKAGMLDNELPGILDFLTRWAYVGRARLSPSTSLELLRPQQPTLEMPHSRAASAGPPAPPAMPLGHA